MNIKIIPEDFRVKENISLDNYDKGNYLLCIIERKSMDHFTMLSLLSEHFRINEKKIGFSGIKDKNAIILQYVSLPLECQSKFNENRIVILDDKSFLSIENIGRIVFPLSIGNLDSNDFEIIVREISNNERDSFEKKKDYFKDYRMPNYFGDQRFGQDYNNVRIGYYMIKKDFTKSSFLLGLEKSNNPLESLRRTSRRLRMLMISAFQSAIFNIVLSGMITKKYFSIPSEPSSGMIDVIIMWSKNRKYGQNISDDYMSKKISLPGLGMEPNDEITRILGYLDISERDFAIRQMPELLLEPAIRNAFVSTKIDYSWIDEKTLSLMFNLPRGSYATILLESLFH